VKGDSSINGFKDLIEYIRKNPGTKWAINNKSSPSYSLVRQIAKAENLNIVMCPSLEILKASVALLGGQVPVGSPTVAGNEVSGRCEET